MSDQDRSERSWRRRLKDALRTERSDPHLAKARTHLHLELLDIPERVSAFVSVDAQTRATVMAMLARRIEEHQPGTRAVGLSAFVNGIIAVGGMVVTVLAVVIAGAFGLLVASTNPETGVISGVDSDSISWFTRVVLTVLAVVVGVVLLVGLTMWRWQRDNDRARAVHVAWLRLYESALDSGEAAVRRGGVIQRVLAAVRGVAT
jgi:hypothetical protein